MDKFFLRLNSIKFGVLLSAALLIGNVANSATYSAVASGSWSNTNTWGGAVPATTNTTDQITIPTGINVTMDNDVYINGVTASISVMGTLSSATSNFFNVKIGTISGSGIITVDSIAFGSGAYLLFTGSLTASDFTNSASSLLSAALITVNNSLTLAAGTLSVQTSGSLTPSGNSTIIVSGGVMVANGGAIVLTSNYHVIYNQGTTLAGLELGGTGLQNVTMNVGSANTLTLSTDMTVKGTLILTSGTLVLATHHLTLAGNVAASGTGTIFSTIASNINITAPTGLAGIVRFSDAVSGVNNFNVNIGSANQASISGPLTINGTLTLTSGVLYLDSADLNFTGNISASGTGTISSNAKTHIAVNTSTSPGTLRFTSGSSTINKLNINIGDGGSISVASNLTITGALTLTSGHVNIGNNTLTMAATGNISGANANAYIITDSTGSLAITLTVGTTGRTTFPIGTPAAYFPAIVTLNVGSLAGMVKVGVSPNVYANGTTGTDLSFTRSMVDATWHVESDIVATLDLNLELLWDNATEVNGFSRGTSRISHYTAGKWDYVVATAAVAISGGMYSMTRTNITSLSPFAIFDQNTTAVESVISKSAVEIYPNPATETITFNNLEVTNEAVSIDIIDICGKIVGSYKLTNTNNSIPINQLSSGSYLIRLYNNKMNTTQSFIKI
jgi:hypothetical protein